MFKSATKIPLPKNEPVYNYTPKSPEAELLKKQLKKMMGKKIDIPVIIGGKEIRTNNTGVCRCPHNHKHILARYHKAGPKEIELAVKSAKTAWRKWSKTDSVARAFIFLRAAELLSTKYRHILNAATMLCQSKTAYQAELDSACELIDFYRFNIYYMNQIYAQQPISSTGVHNYMEYRPLEGFIFAITPFNFTSIAGNLSTAPALMGNTILWKPAASSVYSGFFIMKLLKEAGLPDGVINFIPGDSRVIGNIILQNPDLAGVHFTGSTAVFQQIWKTIGNNITNYKNYPRIVGETGGKDFVFVHSSAEIKTTVTALIRGAFEYQGQKCSAASRAYIPSNLWPKIKEKLLDEVKTIKQGDIANFSNFMGAVIDKPAFDKIASYIDFAKKSKDAKFLCGGKYDDSRGYFIEPTVIITTNPKHKLMEEEIFGPVLTIYVYPEKDFEKTLELCDNTSPYGLTGAILANNKKAVKTAFDILRFSAGNFYINDKPTGAVVGQQPFGGARQSGTNDKAGSYLNLIRWTSPRTIKENLNPPKDYRYPHMKS